MYEIAGVHHVALGVKNLETMTAFYKDILELNTVHQVPPADSHGLMSGITRGVVPVFNAGMLSRDAGGIIVEFINMITPVPCPIRWDFRYGDIGANKMTIAVSNVDFVYRELKDKVNFCSSPKFVELFGFGDYNFVYCKDPEGNLVEFVSGAGFTEKDKFGGVCSVGISVTDLNRSLPFYQKYTGFDTFFIQTHENFSGLVDEISGNKHTKVRSCVLSSSKGSGMVELIEVMEPRGRSIPSYTSWGDFGYLQTCMMCKNVPEIADHFEKEGFEFFIKLQLITEGENAAFIYVRDPDGIPLEFLSFDEPE